ncbi:MAG: hypothetical protein R3F05_19375 [Planctomycetota bacterium]
MKGWVTKAIREGTWRRPARGGATCSGRVLALFVVAASSMCLSACRGDCRRRTPHPAAQARPTFEQTVPLDGIPADLVLASAVGRLPDTVVRLIRFEVARALTAWSDSGRDLDRLGKLTARATVRAWPPCMPSEEGRQLAASDEVALHVVLEADSPLAFATGSFRVVYRRGSLAARAAERRYGSGGGMTGGPELAPSDFFLRRVPSEDW